MTRFRVTAALGLPLPAGVVLKGLPKEFMARHDGAVKALSQGRVELLKALVLKRGTEFAIEALPKGVGEMVDALDAQPELPSAA